MRCSIGRVEGLRLLVQIKQQQRIRRYRGKLRWEGDLDGMRSDTET
jgi:hypothetical protein